MATVTGYTATRMKQIEDETIVDAELSGDDLILKRRDDVPINVGNIRGLTGLQGPQGNDADFGGYTEPMLYLPTASGTVTLDLSSYNVWYIVPSGAITIAVTNVPAAMDEVASGTIFMKNSDYAVTWPGTAVFPYGDAPELSDFCILSIIATSNDLIITTNMYEIS